MGLFYISLDDRIKLTSGIKMAKAPDHGMGSLAGDTLCQWKGWKLRPAEHSMTAGLEGVEVHAC